MTMHTSNKPSCNTNVTLEKSVFLVLFSNFTRDWSNLKWSTRVIAACGWQNYFHPATTHSQTKCRNPLPALSLLPSKVLSRNAFLSSNSSNILLEQFLPTNTTMVNRFQEYISPITTIIICSSLVFSIIILP